MRTAAVVLLATILPVACRAPDPAPDDARFAAAETLYYAAEFDSARALWSAILASARMVSDSLREARALTWIALAARQQGRYEEARETGERAVSLLERLDAPSELSHAYNALGVLADEENRLDDAERFYEAALEAGRSADDEAAVGRASGNLGLIRLYRGDLDAARAGFLALLTAGRATENARWQGNGLANLAMLDIWSGEASSALPRLDSARTLYRQSGFVMGEINALGQASTALRQLGDHARALAAIDSALVLARDAGIPDEEATLMRLRASLFADAGDLPRALTELQAAAAIIEDMGAESELGIVLREMAAVRMRFGTLDAARSDIRRALTLHREADERFEELDDVLVLVDVERQAAQPDSASSALRSARRLGRELDNRYVRIALALAEATLAEAAGDAAAMIDVLSAADSDVLPGDAPSEVSVHSLLARAHALAGNTDSAIVHGRRAVAALQRVRQRMAPSPLRVGDTVDGARTYSELVLALLRAGRTDEAFAVADAGRGRALFEHLAAMRPALTAEAGDLAEAQSILHQIDALLDMLRDLERTAPRERTSQMVSQAHEVEGRIALLRSRYEDLLSRLASHSSRTSSADRAVEATIPRSAIAPGEALLQFLVAPDRIVIFVLRRDTLVAVQSTVRPADLGGRIRILRDLWGRPDSRWELALPASRAIYDDLIAPIEAAGLLDGIVRLVIVPHGALGQLPFAALMGPNAFLAERFSIRYLPSAATAIRIPTAPDAAEAIAFAPFPERLPASATEVSTIAATLGGTTRSGRAATEAAVRAALRSQGIVHIASHGILNARNPLFSRIELASGRRLSAEDDGRLEAHELLSLRIGSTLVFLSGCETGAGWDWSGDATRGVDHTTLAQAFLHAGAQRVVATLWRIDDEGAGEFAAAFYRALARGPAEDALSSSQREMLAHERFRHPYYWAGYALTGTSGVGAQTAGSASVP